VEQFAACWEGLEDPRSGNAGLHDFHELLIIALCAVLCGGQGAVDMAEFAKAKEPFLRGFLKLANGVPSHDTFSRLFRQLDPEQFRTTFQRFMTKFSETCQGVVAIDGKVLRRSFDRASEKSGIM
jgi:DDE_Tnp_1-associated